jgi:hypothetical protein
MEQLLVQQKAPLIAQPTVLELSTVGSSLVIKVLRTGSSAIVPLHLFRQLAARPMRLESLQGYFSAVVSVARQ